MIVSINQPAYLPWLGYFDRILKSDLHIVLDSVQFEKNSFINRNKIRVGDSWSWLTVPVKTKKKFLNMNIYNLKIDNSSNWRKKHLKSIIQNYSNSHYFKDHLKFFEKTYDIEWYNLNQLIEYINKYILEFLHIKTKIISSYQLNPKQSKSDLILELCQKVGAQEYLSGPFGRDYLDKKDFDKLGIKLNFHDYSHPTYSQIKTGFLPYMSVIDLLFNQGNNSIKILKT